MTEIMCRFILADKDSLQAKLGEGRDRFYTKNPPKLFSASALKKKFFITDADIEVMRKNREVYYSFQERESV